MKSSHTSVRSEPIVSVQEVSLTYGSGRGAVTAVCDVSLELRRGEVMLFMGPSGSGKTTLLELIAALLRPTMGHVFFENQRLDQLDARALAAFRRKRCGFIFQQYNLIGALNAWENVAIAAELQGSNLRDAESRSHTLLDYVGLSHRMNAYPAQMSGGEKQRIAIARAIVGDPDLILADEPTAALDGAAGAHVAELLRLLAIRYNRAVVVVTHDPRLTAIGDRIATLEDGRLRSVTDTSFRGKYANLSNSLVRRASS